MKQPSLPRGVAVATCAVGLLIPAVPAVAAPPAAPDPVPGPVPGPARGPAPAAHSDVREIPFDAKYSTEQLELTNRAQSRSPAAATPAVGTRREWLGLDDAQGILYLKDYTLRAVGAKTSYAETVRA